MHSNTIRVESVQCIEGNGWVGVLNKECNDHTISLNH